MKKNQAEENFLRYLELVQTTLSHLLQDGEALGTGVEQVKSLLSTTEDLHSIYTRSQ